MPLCHIRRIKGREIILMHLVAELFLTFTFTLKRISTMFLVGCPFNFVSVRPFPKNPQRTTPLNAIDLPTVSRNDCNWMYNAVWMNACRRRMPWQNPGGDGLSGGAQPQTKITLGGFWFFRFQWEKFANSLPILPWFFKDNLTILWKQQQQSPERHDGYLTQDPCMVYLPTFTIQINQM